MPATYQKRLPYSYVASRLLSLGEANLPNEQQFAKMKFAKCFHPKQPCLVT